MQRKSLKELKRLILKDIELCEYFIEGMEGNENPQVIKMANEERARLQTFNDILVYINNGDKYGFRKL